jgi:hypothetical protein
MSTLSGYRPHGGKLEPNSLSLGRFPLPARFAASNANVDVGALVVCRWQLGLRWGVWVAALALSAFLCRTLAFAGDALHSLDGDPAGPRDCRWPGCDWMDRVHR